MRVLPDLCVRCGKNIRLVGRVHHCMRFSPLEPHIVTPREDRPKRVRVNRRRPEAGDPGLGDGVKVTIREIGLPYELWSRIDAYRHGQKLRSRTAALRALLERGLKDG